MASSNWNDEMKAVIECGNELGVIAARHQFKTGAFRRDLIIDDEAVHPLLLPGLRMMMARSFQAEMNELSNNNMIGQP